MIRQQHLVASAVTLLVIATGWARAADRVIETTGGKENAHSGKITRDDRDGVAIRMSSGITPEFRREFVKKVEYECLASHYASGESLFDLGQYGLAQMRYAQAEEARDLAEWAKQYVFRRLAQCHERLSGKEHDQKAVEYWEKTRNAVPAGKGLFMREAVEGLLNGYAKLGLWDKASQMLAELEGMGDSEKLMARVYGAGINEKRGRFPEAADAYKKVSEGRPEPNVETKALALAGLARCSVEAKNWAEAVSASTKILAMEGQVPESALAVAFQVQGENKVRGLLGETPKALSEDKAKTEKVIEGITDMLRAAIQYKGNAWAEQRALYFVGTLSEKLEKAGSGPEWQDRARHMYTTLKADFPDTKWAAEAAARLKAMGAG
jgi:hypothetical protein